MKLFLARTWLVCGILSVLFMGLCPYVSWYALSNLAVFGCAAYLVYLATKRRKRMMQIKEVFKKMTRKEKKALEEADHKEVSSIASLSKMMPYLCFGCLLLNAYTYYYYNLEQGTAFGLIPGMNETASLILMAAGLLFGVLFYFGFCFKMNQLMDLS